MSVFVILMPIDLRLRLALGLLDEQRHRLALDRLVGGRAGLRERPRRRLLGEALLRLRSSASNAPS